MVFSGISFLYYFLPIVFVLYLATPRRGRNLLLLAASFFFYGWGEIRLLIWFGITILIGYFAGIIIESNRVNIISKITLIISLTIILGALIYFKYMNFFIVNINHATGLAYPLLKISLPIGISFYTFQIVGYLIDVYKNRHRANRNIIELALFISFFPQLIAGPIVRYEEALPYLRNREIVAYDIREGFNQFIKGLALKVILANSLGELTNLYSTGSSYTDKTLLFTYLYAFGFMLQIYFDFAGYSQMAIGLGRIFGFRLPKNFDYPYISGSITEFWRRWHISLGSFFRDYVYIPLGGNRCKTLRWLINIFIVWLLTGAWHGAEWNFIIWGLLFGILLACEKLFLLKWLKKLPVISHIYTLFAIMAGFVVFNASTLNEALADIGALFGYGINGLYDSVSLFLLGDYGILLILGAVFATPLPEVVFERVLGFIDKEGKRRRFIVDITSICLLLLSTAFLVDSSFNPFLYFRF